MSPQRSAATPRRRNHDRLSLFDASAMAIGGMIGGGIFSVLGLAVDVAGHLAFACFVLGAMLAAVTARSYAALGVRLGRSAGPYEYLRAADHPELGGFASWLLIVGYILALAVYGFTFGHYFADLVGGNAFVSMVGSVAVLTVFLFVNLRGIALSTLTEDAMVVAKMAVLAAIAIVGIAHSHAERLAPLANKGVSGLLLGAPVIFVAFEGFELLSYDYDDFANPRRHFAKAMYWAIGATALLYITVTVGSQMLLSDRAIVAQREVAFAAVGEEAFGNFGRVIAALGAMLATSSAINATLFSTARLVRELSHAGELPTSFGLVRDGVPVRALFVLTIGGAALAMVPSLEMVLAFASCAFLIVFVLVNVLYARSSMGPSRVVAVVGAVGCIAATVLLVVDLFRHNKFSLLATMLVGGSVALARRLFVHRNTRES